MHVLESREKEKMKNKLREDMVIQVSHPAASLPFSLRESETESVYGIEVVGYMMESPTTCVEISKKQSNNLPL